ncbi:hypothetical protein OsI_27207 [Oryza sativa Indica Group]|uniref:Uncharacterized protein n=1 Tax=Oryza sativa subsp. indica TaxID=39946 RepID=A2YPL5_ORYSI|nr:hypothetical protein OsI_27207 [Oryza sativa Indica Group]
MAHISDIKLIRTDTTLDLSQKAEKETATCNFEPERQLYDSIQMEWKWIADVAKIRALLNHRNEQTEE